MFAFCHSSNLRPRALICENLYLVPATPKAVARYDFPSLLELSFGSEVTFFFHLVPKGTRAWRRTSLPPLRVFWCHLSSVNWRYLFMFVGHPLSFSQQELDLLYTTLARPTLAPLNLEPFPFDHLDYFPPNPRVWI